MCMYKKTGLPTADNNNEEKVRKWERGEKWEENEERGERERISKRQRR